MTEGKQNRSKTTAEQNSTGPASEDEIIEGEIIEEGSDAPASAGAPASADAATSGEDADVTARMAREYSELAEELQQAQGKAKEFFEGWQRERADFANYKRRVDRDQQTLAQNIKGDVIKKYLSVLDDLERAMKNRPTDSSADNTAVSWANGIELIVRKLQAILEAEGVRRIPAETEEFNPTRHEAITYEDSPNHKSGEIIEVVQQGYTLGDRVLRPALVRVARG
jgi:molecular chaperone GrpE